MSMVEKSKVQNIVVLAHTVEEIYVDSSVWFITDHYIQNR